MTKPWKLIGLSVAFCAAATSAFAGNCAARDAVVQRLQTKYDEQLAMGGLQGTRTTQAVMEVWASRETGTFTVLLTRPDGTTCIVAAGTDFFEAEATASQKGTAS